MGSEATASIASGMDEPGNRAVGADELAQGLMLVRASTMNVVRLQLAMERRDRRVALEAVDDLVVLDGKIRDFLNDMPASASDFGPMQQEIEDQRRSLVREKFTLGAGMGKFTATVGEGRWIEPEPGDEPAGPKILKAREVPPPSNDPACEAEEETAAARRAFPLLLAGILLLLVIAMIAAGFVLGTGGWDETVARISHALGGS